MTKPPLEDLGHALALRFGAPVAADLDPGMPGLEALCAMARRGSHRRFQTREVEETLLRLLCAVALSAPTKSDLQQRDIVILREPEQRRALDDMVAGQAWVRGAPAMLIFCGNNRRQRQIHAWRGHPFVNDHLDAFFNAAVDAGIALAAFVTAAEALGLGCCPVSAVRNRARDVSELLKLPDHIFPVAGLAVGWPLGDAEISPRLPLETTVHVDRFSEDGLRGRVEAYDSARAAAQPYETQRFVEELGAMEQGYGWSEDKSRQYSRPERADFGAFVREKGFGLT